MMHWLRRACSLSVLGVAVAATPFVLSSVPARAFFHDTPDIEGGRAIYAARCASCHGANLEGPPDWQSARVLDDMGVDFTSGMPGFGDELTEDDIEAVLAYIRSTWPDRIRAAQAERSQLEAGSP